MVWFKITVQKCNTPSSYKKGNDRTVIYGD